MLSWCRLSSRVSNTSSESVSILKRIHELGVFVPKNDLPELEWLMIRLCELSFIPDDRPTILEHVWKSLNPSADWHSINNGLRILRGLAMNGSQDLFREISGGLHFDIFQRTLTLTTYSNEDERVSRLIQSLAKTVRNLLVERCSDFGADEIDSTEIQLFNPDVLDRSDPPPPSVHTPDISGTSDLIDL